jgi:hypothetical protein
MDLLRRRRGIWRLGRGARPHLPISVLLLGMGADMHTASLFPGRRQPCRRARRSSAALMAMRAEAAGEPRVTLTAPVLKGAMSTHILITGAEKRAAIERGGEAAPDRRADRLRIWDRPPSIGRSDGHDPFRRSARASRPDANRRILDLFDDPDRAEAFSARADGMLFDYSKTHLDAEAMAWLIALAEAADVPARREAMFGGARINETEGRAVLHTALRAPGGTVMVDGVGRHARRAGDAARMEAFATDVRSGAIAGRAGPIRTWSISASAARTWGPRWRRWRWRPITTGRAALRVERGRRAYP